jgi:hypothetical protein
MMDVKTMLSTEDKTTALFRPDTLLQHEYFEIFRRKTHLQPEKRLMFAVLEDAIACFQKYISARDVKGKGIFHDAESWILDENSDWLFSFAHICEVLGIDPNYLRQGLMRWKQKRLAGSRTAKIYHFNPGVAEKEPGVKMAGRTGERLLKAAVH